jgi:sugar-specific transcriptional regulator TrmB
MKIQNSSFLKKLEKIGLTDKEALVYVSVLELGGAFPSKIAEYAGLNRSTTYKMLLNLSIRGLINEIEKKNKIFYQIDKPEKILRYTETKSRQFENSIEEVKKILPEIDGIYSAGQNRPKIKYLNGLDEILTVFDDMITQTKPYELVAFSNANELLEFLPRDFSKNFVKEKEKKGITTRGIIPDTAQDRKYSENLFSDVDKKYWPEIRYTKEKMFMSSSEIAVYGTNKVSILNFSKNQLTGVVIEDQIIHDMMKVIFELSWNSSLIRD